MHKHLNPISRASLPHLPHSPQTQPNRQKPQGSRAVPRNKASFFEDFLPRSNANRDSKSLQCCSGSPSVRTVLRARYPRQLRNRPGEPAWPIQSLGWESWCLAKSPASADYRLREDPIIKDLIVKLLRRLSAKLQVLSHEHKTTQDIRKPKSDDDCLSDSSASSSLNLSSETDTESEPDTDDDNVNPKGALQSSTVLEDIKRIITRLYRITSIIKMPVSTKEADRVQKWFANEGSELEEQLSDLESFARWAIKRQRPALQHFPFLLDRFIQAIISRRKTLVYRARHRAKLEKGTEDWFAPRSLESIRFEDEVSPHDCAEAHAEETGRDPAKLKGKGKAVAFDATIASTVNRQGLSTYAKSTVLKDISPSVQLGLGDLDVPEPPAEIPGGDETLCPYCSVPLGKELLHKSKVQQWK